MVWCQGWNQRSACREEVLEEPWQVGKPERARTKSPTQFLPVRLAPHCTLCSTLCLDTCQRSKPMLIPSFQ